MRHESYDACWKEVSDEEKFSRVQVPVMTQAGWFDIFLPGTINGFVGVRRHAANERARQLTRKVIGPWGHGPSQKYGDLDFGPDADRQLFDYEVRWYEFHMKGMSNGVETDAPVQIVYMGVNRWRGEADWPIPGTRETPWYLQEGGRLGPTTPTGEGSTSYRYDPNDQVPTTGGNNCCGAPTIAGPVDQAPLDARQDIVRFTSDTLTRIRVDITSSNLPQFDRNLNTGDPLGTGTQPRVARQTIWHSAMRPSAIVLPVVRGF